MRGLAHVVMGDFDLALSDLEIALRLVRAGGQALLEWQLMLDLGRLWSSRDYQQAGRHFEAALDLVRDLGETKWLAQSLNQIGNWYLNVDSPRKALTYHEEALVIFRELGDQSGLGQTYDLLGMTSLLGGDPVRGAAYCREAIEIFDALDARQSLASCLTTLSICSPVHATETVTPANLSSDDVERWGQRAITIAREIRWPAGEVYSLSQAGQCKAAAGQYGQALAFMQRGLEIAEEIEHWQWLSLVHRELGKLHFDLLALPMARHHFEHALAYAHDLGSAFHIRRTTGYLIAQLLAERRISQARTLLDSIWRPQLPMETLSQRLLWCGQTELALLQGDSASALQILDRLIATAANVEDIEKGSIPHLARLRGVTLMALKRWTKAEETLLAALATARAQEQPRLVWRINITLGQLHRAQDLYAKAQKAFDDAYMVIDEIAATIPDSELRDNFVRSATAMMEQPQPSTHLQMAKQAHGGLTRREREVAVLVGQGKSNREIANALVLGVRTVEGHVSNILGKLDFASRTEIAVWVIENQMMENDQLNVD